MPNASPKQTCGANLSGITVKLVAIYSVGFISMACSISRVWSLWAAKMDWMDVIRGQFILTFTTMLEAFAAIICANMPVLSGGFLRLQKIQRELSAASVYQQSNTSPSIFASNHKSSVSQSTSTSVDLEAARKRLSDEG